MLRATTVALCACLIAGCSGSPAGGDGGAADARTDGDGAATGGLTFLFTATGLPDVTPAISVDEVRLGLRDLRAVGDAAPGDSRTSVADWSFDLKSDQPRARLAFPAAPPGIYSSFAARLPGSQGFEVRGQVRLSSGTRVEFRIENARPTGQIYVGLDGLKVEAVPRIATIEVSLAFLANVDWDGLAHGTDPIEIQPDSPAMAGIVAALPGAFSLGPVQ